MGWNQHHQLSGLGSILCPSQLCCCSVSLSCQILWNPMDCSLPGSSAHGFLQTRTPEWLAVSSSRGSSWLMDRARISCLPCISRQILYSWDTWEAPLILLYEMWEWKSLSCVWLFVTPMDYRVHGILQARILEWVTFPFSRGSSRPRDQTQVSHIVDRFFTSWATREAREYWRG